MLKRFKDLFLGKSFWLPAFPLYCAVCLANIAFWQVLQDLPLSFAAQCAGVCISMPVVAFSVVNSVLTLAHLFG